MYKCTLQFNQVLLRCTWCFPVYFNFHSYPEVAPALWVCHRPRAHGTAHYHSEPIRGDSLDGGGERRRGHFQLGPANQSAAHQPGLGLVHVPVYRDQLHQHLMICCVPIGQGLERVCSMNGKGQFVNLCRGSLICDRVIWTKLCANKYIFFS